MRFWPKHFWCPIFNISCFNHKGYYHVTDQAKFDLMAFKKKLTKSEKYRKNVRIVKILLDSVFVGLIYLSHLKNRKSVRSHVRTFLNGTFYAMKNLLKFEKIEKNCRRAKIFADSVSAGPIYIFHLKMENLLFDQNRINCKGCLSSFLDFGRKINLIFFEWNMQIRPPESDSVNISIFFIRYLLHWI